MMFRKIIAFALTCVLSGSVLASYSQNYDEDYELGWGWGKQALKSYTWDISLWMGGWFTPSDEKHTNFETNDWVWGSQDPEDEGKEIDFDYEAISDYHKVAAQWWLELICPPGMQMNHDEFLENLEEFIAWKKKGYPWPEGNYSISYTSTEVPVPAAFVFFASALSALGIRKKFSQ